VDDFITAPKDKCTGSFVIGEEVSEFWGKSEDDTDLKEPVYSREGRESMVSRGENRTVAIPLENAEGAISGFQVFIFY
jgi:hypothetical protein